MWRQQNGTVPLVILSWSAFSIATLVIVGAW